jgi:hypothetical protein
MFGIEGLDRGGTNSRHSRVRLILLGIPLTLLLLAVLLHPITIALFPLRAPFSKSLSLANI